GFFAVRRIRSEGVHILPEGFHPSGYVPRSGTLTLFAVYSSLGPAGLFRPANALRLPPSGISPPRKQSELVARTLPSCRSSGSTALLLLRVRAAAPAVSACAGRFPPGFFPLQGLPLPSDATGSSPLAPPIRFGTDSRLPGFRIPALRSIAHPDGGIFS